MSYLNVVEVETAMANLAAAFPSLTQLITLPHTTVEGRTSHALRIGGGSAGSRDVVMITGGQHAREWGSCEICVDVAADLLEAYDTNAGLAYGGKSFSASQVKGIVEGLHVVVFPLVNPDGRHHSQQVDSIGGSGGWRRNRNPAYSGNSPDCVGVDLNRNYDFLFDFGTKFHPAAPLSISADPCDSLQRYHGPSAFSETETQNVRWLLNAFPRTRWFIDVHSFSQLVLYNWGDDNNQSTNPSMNFRNPAHDGQRGLVSGDTTYREYIPAGDELIARTLAERTRDAIAAVRGIVYIAEQAVDLYPTCGTSKDYAYARHFLDPSQGRVYGFTIEWGTQFRPLWTEMEEIIKDVSAGLIEFCLAAPCAAGLIGIALDTPSLQFIDVPAGDETSRAAVFTIQSCSAVTLQVQAGPTVTMGPGSFSLPFGGVEALPAAPSAEPRTVRIWVSFTGTNPGDVTTGSVTIRCPETAQDFVIPITANTIAQPRIASVLVLDRSGSMFDPSGVPGKLRLDVLHDSAPIYVELLPDNHGIGVVSFDHDAYPVKPVVQADAGGRTAANAGIAAHTPTGPGALTAIGDGVELAHTTLQPLMGYDEKATVVFTDGHETAGQYIADVAALITERVFALGLGTASQLNPVALNALVNNTDGYLLLTGDLTSHDDLRVEKYFSQIQAGVSNAEVVVDPDGSIGPGVKHRIPFAVTETDRAASVFLLSPAPWAIDFLLETPQGALIDPVMAAALPGVEFSTGQRVHQYRVTFPVPIGAGARQGLWHAVLSIGREQPKQYLFDDRQRRAASSVVHGVRYSLNVHAFSSLRMAVQVVQSSYEPGATLTLHAVLTESALPVERRARVHADVTRPDGTSATLSLAEIESGVFEASLPATLPGVYPIRFRAQGTTLRGYPFTREQLRTAAVWRGGNGTPPSSSTQPSEPGLDWCRLVACLLGQKSIVEVLRRHGIDVDDLRRCWKEQCAEDPPRATLEAMLADPGFVQRLAAHLKSAP